jgi:hypothetical protein
LIDIAPTVLSMFGIDVPDYMDGKALSFGASEAKTVAPRRDTLAEALR